MPTNAQVSALILPPPKAAGPKPPPKNIGPLKTGIGPLPMSKALVGRSQAVGKAPAPRAPAPNLRAFPKPYEGAPKLQATAKRVPYEPYKAPKGGSFLDELTHGLEKGGMTALGAAIPALGMGAAGNPATQAVVKNVTEHTLGTAKAFAKEPGPVTKHTLSSLPNIANSLAMMAVRGGEETALGIAKGVPGMHVPKGTGEPLKTIEEFGKQAVHSTVKTVSEKQKEVEEEVKKEGAANQVLTYAPTLGVGVGVGGRLITKAVKATKFGAAEYAAQSAARDANIIAHQYGPMHDFLQQGQPIPSEPTLGLRGKTKAFIHETAAQPRPNIRTAPGREPPKLERGAAVKPQERSSNFFRSAG